MKNWNIEYTNTFREHFNGFDTKNPVGMAHVVAVDFNSRLPINHSLLSSVGTVHIIVIYMYRSYGTQ